MINCRALLPVALAFSLCVAQPLEAAAGFNDGDFTTYTWAAAELQDTTASHSASFSAGEVPTGGVSGGAYRSNYLSFSFNGSPTNQGILVANIAGGILYSPAVSGAINSVASFSLAASASFSGGAPATFVGLVLLQGGTYYTNILLAVQGFGIPLKVASPQLAADFTWVGSAGPVHPDFSTNGGPIDFGYVTSASLSSGAPASVTGTIGVDQFALSISNTASMARFTSQQAVGGTNIQVALAGLAPGENVVWLVSTNLVDWPTNNPSAFATGTNGTYAVTNSVYPGAATWFLRALIW